MKKVIGLLFASLFATSAYSATLAPLDENATCTRDFHRDWNGPSACACPAPSLFAIQFKSCVVGAEEKETVTVEITDRNDKGVLVEPHFKSEERYKFRISDTYANALKAKAEPGHTVTFTGYTIGDEFVVETVNGEDVGLAIDTSGMLPLETIQQSK